MVAVCGLVDAQVGRRRCVHGSFELGLCPAVVEVFFVIETPGEAHHGNHIHGLLFLLVDDHVIEGQSATWEKALADVLKCFECCKTTQGHGSFVGRQLLGQTPSCA